MTATSGTRSAPGVVSCERNRESREGVAVFMQLKYASAGALRMLRTGLGRAWWSCVWRSRRLLAVVLSAGDQSQLRLRRARLREGRGLLSCGLFVGWCGPVGCSPRLAPEATRLLPGAQPAVASTGFAGSCCRRLHSRQKPGRASPARRGEQPTSAEVRALRFGSRCKILHSFVSSQKIPLLFFPETRLLSVPPIKL
jgi:hypothetical protein